MTTMTEVLAVIQDLGSHDVEGLPVARSSADDGQYANLKAILGGNGLQKIIHILEVLPAGSTLASRAVGVGHLAPICLIW